MRDQKIFLKHANGGTYATFKTEYVALACQSGLAADIQKGLFHFEKQSGETVVLKDSGYGHAHAILAATQDPGDPDE